MAPPAPRVEILIKFLLFIDKEWFKNWMPKVEKNAVKN
jgi:hypothetical protein